MSSKKTNKRLESTKEYLDSLQAKHSKLNIVRVDLGYKKPHSDNLSLDDANKDLNKMLNNRRGKPSVFENQVGYIVKKEQTKDKGVHFHTAFIYDGNKVQKSSFKADQIGKYWSENITKDKGSHHNCHRNKYKNNGIGMLEHNDIQKRKDCDNAISYLCKNEQKDNSENDIGNRNFVRGTIPKNEEKRGRPRTIKKID